MMRAKISVMMVLIGLANAEANLVVNGDFESGNTGFTSFYQYNPVSPGTEGDYYIGSNSMDWNGAFPAPVYDHTTGSGLMLLGNGINNQAAVWQQTVNVTAGVEYEFSGWMAALHGTSLPRMEFLVNGQSLGNDSTTALIWTEFSSLWVASQSGTATHTTPKNCKTWAFKC